MGHIGSFRKRTIGTYMERPLSDLIASPELVPRLNGISMQLLQANRTAHLFHSIGASTAHFCSGGRKLVSTTKRAPIMEVNITNTVRYRRRIRQATTR